MRKLSLVLLSVAFSSNLVACSSDDSTPLGPADASSDGGQSAGDSGSSHPDSSTSGGDAGADSGATADTGSAADAGHDVTSPVESGADAPSAETGSTDAGADTGPEAGADAGPDAAAEAGGPTQVLVTTVDPGTVPIAVTINQGTAIGQGSGNGATPSTLTNVAADPNNTQTIPNAKGNVPDTAAGFCDYSGATPKRVSYVTGAKFEAPGADGGPGTDPMVPMAPFYFPLTYWTTNTPTGNAFGGKPPIIGLFDWRPKDIDEAVVVAESDDNGRTWYFMQTVLELFPDLTNPISGGYSPTATDTGCPATVTATHASTTSANGSTADDGWGHASIIQLPGAGNVKTGQFLYMLDRNPNGIVDVAGLRVINITGSSNKFPIWNTNSTAVGANDIKSIGSALTNTTGTASPVVVQQTVGLLDPDGIMAVFPTAPTAAAGSAVTVLYVQKILDGDDTGATAMPTAQQCAKAPFSGKTNHDISNVRMGTTTDGVHFTDLGVVSGLNDPTTVDYNGTRWISPRGTLIDIHGDGSVWGLYFAGGNCLDGDSDAFHYIGYAESTDRMHWTVFNDINHPIASINTITTTNQADGKAVTIPAHDPVFPTQAWFGQRLYAPSATQIDATHLSLTFAGYAVQSPSADLLAYRQIGNVVLTVSLPLPQGVPNNINAH
jgi:hypothetical protein